MLCAGINSEDAMDKIYYVIIKGRTLESRDLKELLARAVAEKRNLDRRSRLQTRFCGPVNGGNASSLCADAGRAAML